MVIQDLEPEQRLACSRWTPSYSVVPRRDDVDLSGRYAASQGW